jgi:hypothetical protein
MKNRCQAENKIGRRTRARGAHGASASARTKLWNNPEIYSLVTLNGAARWRNRASEHVPPRASAPKSLRAIQIAELRRRAWSQAVVPNRALKTFFNANRRIRVSPRAYIA